MKLLRIIYFSWIVLLLSGCSSHKNADSEQAELTLDQYESYLKSAVYGTMNQVNEDPALTRERHIEYFTIVTGNRKIAKTIYDEAVKYNISPELAFALVFSESGFDPNAVNVNDNSVDRGLFQLNSKSFPNLKEADFFKPEINIPLGIAYLRYCLDMGGNEVAALAMYNAGPNRVKDSRTPKMTLDYIAKIQDLRISLEEGIIPDEFDSTVVPIPDIKSIKNVTLLMEQSGKIN
ncbi:lytic transglycosylase domain-containing protein [Oceanispirochaeta crateris]|uniref:Lytic transglycosylase domain-containing protein n=1 Tax=Oceanispirochaeta crateris TaxID=2518645 RepID=A0A5C1QMJ5_9SPIO|nr:transglycosylase SLT domain-containing protein [Oceanispirochaeta crateris]QEN09315.1 lytic transglycosylase domain-containing protein [Oceanispirochaeta crateris]